VLAHETGLKFDAINTAVCFICSLLPVFKNMPEARVVVHRQGSIRPNCAGVLPIPQHLNSV